MVDHTNIVKDDKEQYINKVDQLEVDLSTDGEDFIDLMADNDSIRAEADYINGLIKKAY